MAILSQGILGGGRGAVGTVVMTRWKGKDVIRARVSPSNPNTPAQQRTRALFRSLAAMAAPLMSAFVRPYWRRFERGTTAYNEFMRANQRVMRSPLVVGLQAPGVFDPAKAVLARGPLVPAEATGVADDGDGDTEVSWDGGVGEAGDAVAVVVLRKADGSLKGVFTGYTRADDSAVLGLPFAEAETHVFHVLAYQPGATPQEAVVALNSSVGFDDAGVPVVVPASARAAALAAGKEDEDEVEPEGALV